MSNKLKIGLIGDFNPDVTAHQAIPIALEIAADENNLELDYDWLNTVSLVTDLNELLSSFNGFWAVPASPYKNVSGVLSAIRYARENRVPYLGTCGGYQHAVLEFALNVLKLPDAENAEVNPDASFPLINPLVCSLVEQKGEIYLCDNTKIRDIYRSSIISEQYRCSFGFNREYLHLFTGSDLVVSGFDSQGDPRSIELTEHPFYIATAFQPERAALQGKNHLLVNQFILSASE